MAENDRIKQEEMYIGEIKGGLKPSMRLVVMGIVKQQPKSMVVAVVCHPEDDTESDVGLQLTVSFQDRAVLRNARLKGKWGASENALSYFPFAAGEPFKMEIVCEHQQFELWLMVSLFVASHIDSLSLHPSLPCTSMVTCS